MRASGGIGNKDQDMETTHIPEKRLDMVSSSGRGDVRHQQLRDGKRRAGDRRDRAPRVFLGD